VPGLLCGVAFGGAAALRCLPRHLRQQWRRNVADGRRRGTQRKWSVAAAAAAAACENGMSGNEFPYRGGVL